MNIDVGLAIKIIVAALCLVIGFGSYFYGPFAGKADNPIEQAAEEIIKEDIGITIDLSPDIKAKPNDKTN